jgi:cobalamin synthase
LQFLPASGSELEEKGMNISLSIGPVVSLIAGILILIVPRLLNIIVAIYLIVIGLLGLFGTGAVHLH